MLAPEAGERGYAVARTPPDPLLVPFWGNTLRRSHRERTTTVPDVWVLAVDAAASALITLGPAPRALAPPLPASADLSPLGREARGEERSRRLCGCGC